MPTDFVDVRLPGARPYLQDASDGFPALRLALGDVLQRQLVVEHADGAALAPQRHVVMRRVVRLRRAAPEQLGGPVVERRAVVKSVATQVARFFHCSRVWKQNVEKTKNGLKNKNKLIFVYFR